MRTFFLRIACLVVITLGKRVNLEAASEEGSAVHHNTVRKGHLEQFKGRALIDRSADAPVRKLLAVLLLGLSTPAESVLMSGRAHGLQNHRGIQRLQRNWPVMEALPAEGADSITNKSLDNDDVEYRIDPTDNDNDPDDVEYRGWEYTKEEFMANHGDTIGLRLWDSQAPPAEAIFPEPPTQLSSLPPKSWDSQPPPAEAIFPEPPTQLSSLPPKSPRQVRFSRRGALLGSLAVGMAGLLAEGSKLVEGVAGAAGKLSEAGVMLRAAQVAEFDETFLRGAARLTEKQAAKEGLNMVSWQQMSAQVSWQITELEQLPACAKAAEKLRDIKQIADMGPGTLSAAEFASIADKYALARKELEVAFKALPSALRTSGELEVRELLAAEEEILIAEEARLLQLERAAGTAGVPVIGAGVVVASEAAIANVIELAKMKESILRSAATLSEEQLASSSLSLTRQQVAATANFFLERLPGLESLPGFRSARRALEEVAQIAGKGSGPFTQSELSSMADKYARAQKDLAGLRVPTQLQRMERSALERAKGFRDTAEGALRKLGAGNGR